MADVESLEPATLVPNATLAEEERLLLLIEGVRGTDESGFADAGGGAWAPEDGGRAFDVLLTGMF